MLKMEVGTNVADGRRLFELLANPAAQRCPPARAMAEMLQDMLSEATEWRTRRKTALAKPNPQKEKLAAKS